MKKNLKQALVPLAVMVFGAAAAFATNAAKQSDKSQAASKVYHYDITKPAGARCVETVAECLEADGPVCTDFANRQVWKMQLENETSCTTYLSRLPIN